MSMSGSIQSSTIKKRYHGMEICENMEKKNLLSCFDITISVTICNISIK